MTDAFDTLMEMSRAYEPACVMIAAAELDLFTLLIQNPCSSVTELAVSLRADERALTVLVGSLATLRLLEMEKGRLRVPDEFVQYLDSNSAHTVVPMLRHRGSCLRSWAQLAWTVKSGAPFPMVESVNGALDDYRSFVLAMHSIGARKANPLVSQMKQNGLPRFKRLLDLGGASGTYTLAFLEQYPDAEAIIFDLPIAIEEARHRFSRSPGAANVQFVAGDFYRDKFPAPVDLVWISAIIHQQDELQTEEMFRKSHAALAPGGTIAIRDVYIDSDRTGPPAATFFGVNMLCRTERGRVYTKTEVFDLLRKTGFHNPRMLVESSDMGSVITSQRG